MEAETEGAEMVLSARKRSPAEERSRQQQCGLWRRAEPRDSACGCEVATSMLGRRWCEVAARCGRGDGWGIFLADALGF
jgi:hypothetical protein